VEIHIPGMVAEGTYRFALAEDGMSITWQRAINRVCLNKESLRGVMGEKYLSSSSRVIAYDDATQEMCHNKVSHNAGGQYWGAPQVIRLREECTGTPTKSIYPYPTNNVIRGHRQYNTLARCRVQLAKQRFSNATKTHVRTIDLFGIQSSQSSHDDPPSPPPPSPRIALVSARGTHRLPLVWPPVAASCPRQGRGRTTTTTSTNTTDSCSRGQ
jgi:hypothetical protein